MMGKPQPLNTFEQNNPSFEPRISKAIRIQRVMLFPWEQQFIKNLLCFAAGDMYFDFFFSAMPISKIPAVYLSNIIVFQCFIFCVKIAG